MKLTHPIKLIIAMPFSHFSIESSRMHIISAFLYIWAQLIFYVLRCNPIGRWISFKFREYIFYMLLSFSFYVKISQNAKWSRLLKNIKHWFKEFTQTSVGFIMHEKSVNKFLFHSINVGIMFNFKVCCFKRKQSYEIKPL